MAATEETRFTTPATNADTTDATNATDDATAAESTTSFMSSTKITKVAYRETLLLIRHRISSADVVEAIKSHHKSTKGWTADQWIPLREAHARSGWDTIAKEKFVADMRLPLADELLKHPDVIAEAMRKFHTTTSASVESASKSADGTGTAAWTNFLQSFGQDPQVKALLDREDIRADMKKCKSLPEAMQRLMQPAADGTSIVTALLPKINEMIDSGGLEQVGSLLQTAQSFMENMGMGAGKPSKPRSKKRSSGRRKRRS